MTHRVTHERLHAVLPLRRTAVGVRKVVRLFTLSLRQGETLSTPSRSPARLRRIVKRFTGAQRSTGLDFCLISRFTTHGLLRQDFVLSPGVPRSLPLYVEMDRDDQEHRLLVVPTGLQLASLIGALEWRAAPYWSLGSHSGYRDGWSFPR